MDDLQPQNPAELRRALVKRLGDLEEQLVALSRERDAVRSDLAVTDQFLAVWNRTHNVHGPHPDIKPSTYLIDSNVPLPIKKPKNPPREMVVNAAVQVIEHHDRPVTRSEMYEALRTCGIEIYGKDPVMVLSTMLWRSQDRIVRLGSMGYWIKNRPYEPAHYIPEADHLLGIAETQPEDGEIEDPEDDDAEVTSAGA